ncbi:MAG: ribosome assembly RNA-binding protein YhbY [Piscirickettsiaceae bacterium]|nr:MAG: ribosome assembly RNA-binding protein YhbY [Piscirickettsiaceae bacterium]PCI68049.1 MAG: ribosome assembly RNA-binding protein YhbY [Piscirickettsiaceae bacterium]
MSLSNAQIKALKAHTHSLKPVVRLGQSGLSPSVLDEVELALEHHELIKVKIAASDRKQKKAFIETIAEKTLSTVIQSIGSVAVFYRENPDKKNYS